MTLFYDTKINILPKVTGRKTIKDKALNLNSFNLNWNKFYGLEIWHWRFHKIQYQEDNAFQLNA